jgi:biotin transporter BioY
MAGGERAGDTATRERLAAVGVAVFAVVCCAGLPLLATLAGGVAVGTLLGVGAGVLAALVAGAALAARARRRKRGTASAVPHPSSVLHGENRR